MSYRSEPSHTLFFTILGTAFVLSIGAAMVMGYFIGRTTERDNCADRCIESIVKAHKSKEVRL